MAVTTTQTHSGTNGISESPHLTKPTGSTGEFNGDIDVNDDLPSQATLAQVGEMQVYDQDGKKHSFNSLVGAADGEMRRILVVFIRHFFCGNCQEYTRTLSETLSPSALAALPVPTSIIIIGHGQPSLIADYARNCAASWPIFADPAKSLYNALGMIRTLDLGKKSPEYMNRASMLRLGLRSVRQGLMAGRQVFKGGDYYQVGGEFLFDATGKPAETAVKWCHRMRNTRDHSEVSQLKTLLGLDGEDAAFAQHTNIIPPSTNQSDTGRETSRRTSKRWSLSGVAGGLGRRLSTKGSNVDIATAPGGKRERSGSPPSQSGLNKLPEEESESLDPKANLEDQTSTTPSTGTAAAYSKLTGETMPTETGLGSTEMTSDPKTNGIIHEHSAHRPTQQSDSASAAPVVTTEHVGMNGHAVEGSSIRAVQE